MAEYYDEPRNESPNILGMAGLLGLGALAGAGGYYALRNAKGRGAAAEALTRAARNERPRGVQMGDLSSRVTGDFGYDPRITGNTQLPNRRPARVTGDMGANVNPRPVAPHAPDQYSNVPPSIPPTTPTSELRSNVYANVAAKPESELPRVYKPQGGTDESMLVTNPNTGEIYRRGGGGSYFASKAAEMAGNVLTDLPEAITPTPQERMVRRQGRMVPLSSVQQKQPAIPTGTVNLNDFLNDIEFSKQLELEEAERYSETAEAQAAMRSATRNVQNIEGVEKARAKNMLLDFRRELENTNLQDQAVDAVESGAAQQTGRVWQQLSRNEDLNKTQVAQLQSQADADYKAMMGSNPSEWSGVEGDVAINTVAQALPDGLPIDQAESLTVLDLRNKQTLRISPRALGQEGDPLAERAERYVRAKNLAEEVDLDYDYGPENRRQAAQVQDRIQRAQFLQNEADRILAELSANQSTPGQFNKAAFNKQYREELNDQLQLVDNARQRNELVGAQPGIEGEDVESLLLGDVPVVDTTMRGKALRGGKLNRVGDISYLDEGGTYASADTGVKARQGQGPEFQARALLTNEIKPLLGRASDEDLTSLLLEGQQSPFRQELKERAAKRFTTYQDPRQLNLPGNLMGAEQEFINTSLDSFVTRLASQTLVSRALKNPNPTPLQTAALNRANASVAASEQILQEARNQSQQRPVVTPGPAQDLARSMETLRRGMVVDPSEPLPVLPPISQLRAGYVDDYEPDLGPVLGASDVYTGAAAQAAGPVIFTGKSKANSVIRGPGITGSINTPTGRYLTQDNPDVLGTVYNVAGTRANRDISERVEANAQAFLADAIAGGLKSKTVSDPESYVTSRGSVTSQLDLFPAEAPQITAPSQPLGLPGIDPSKRTLYAQYQPGRSVPVSLSPFIGEMSGGTVVVQPTPNLTPGVRRDVGASPNRLNDLTRRGESARYFNDTPQVPFVTGLEPAPIGPLTQSPGLSRIGGMTEQVVQGAGDVPVIQATPQGQKIVYPRMPKATTVPGYGQSTVTNIPLYGIDPGAEDWRNDLMRSAYRRGGPIRTYQGDPSQL